MAPVAWCASGASPAGAGPAQPSLVFALPWLHFDIAIQPIEWQRTWLGMLVYIVTIILGLISETMS